MIELPKFENPWKYENGFFLTCNPKRIGKFTAQYEIFKRSQKLPGVIVECGVFKGASLARLAMFRKLFGGNSSKKILAFDTFGEFPNTKYEPDKKRRKQFVENAGSESISKRQMRKVLKQKKCEDNLELVKRDITSTVPKYIENNKQLKISLLHLDTDIYEPAKVILKKMFPRVSRGGMVVVDNYGKFPGETKAVDEFLEDKNKKYTVKKFDFTDTPSYIVKE
jgi:hypothetical protein